MCGMTDSLSAGVRRRYRRAIAPEAHELAAACTCKRFIEDPRGELYMILHSVVLRSTELL